MKVCKRIFIMIMPLFVALLFLRYDKQIPSAETIISEFSSLPNLKDLLITDVNETIDTFKSIPYAFNFQTWQFPSFDASNLSAFFASIGNFFTSFGSNLANTFSSLFGGLGSVFNALFSVLKCIGSTIVNIFNYLLGILRIIFG